MNKIQVRNWLLYSSICWLILVPVYATNVYLYYANSLTEITFRQGLAISFQDILLWVLLSPLLVYTYQQILSTWWQLKRVTLIAAVCALLVVVHVTLDGLLNIALDNWGSSTDGLQEFWLHVGLTKLLPNSLIVTVLMLSILLFGAVDARRQHMQISDTTQAHTDTAESADANAMISIQEKGEIVRIPFQEISHIEAAGNYSCIHHGDQVHIVRRPLSDLITRLPGQWFVRIHRSSIVNVRIVRKFRRTTHGDGEVELVHGKSLRVSRHYRSALESLLTQNSS
ncbi:MAG: LytTR family transcriptional regulator [Pseudomonadales bacterium]|nr:LytTR family transcriptional regulator [Pseudomonadales bacterium]